MLVYVQDRNGKPLMPTQRLGMVRRWLKSGRAKIVRRLDGTVLHHSASCNILQRVEGVRTLRVEA